MEKYKYACGCEIPQYYEVEKMPLAILVVFTTALTCAKHAKPLTTMEIAWALDSLKKMGSQK